MDWLLPALERGEALEHRVDVAEIGLECEYGLEVDALRDLPVGAGELAQIPVFLRRAGGMPLNEPVGVVAGEACVDEREQESLAREQPARRLEVLAHPVRVDDQSLDEPGEAI